MLSRFLTFVRMQLYTLTDLNMFHKELKDSSYFSSRKLARFFV